MPFKTKKDRALYMRKRRREEAKAEGRVIEPRYETRKYRTKRAKKRSRRK